MSKFLALVREGVKIWSQRGTNGFDRLANQMNITAAEEGGKFKFQWTVDESQTNGLKTLHGGYIAFAVDFTTSAVLSAIGKRKTGVSVDLSVSYMKAAKIDDIVTLETDVKKLGSTLAFTEAILKNQHGDILATAKHTKFIGRANSAKHVHES